MAGAPIAPPRCLLVEDEVLIGLDLDDHLCAAGFDVQWMASIRSAWEALATTPFDVAILDLVVRSELCTHLARELVRRRIPFSIYSGRPRDDGMIGSSGVPWLEKPAEPEAVSALLAEIMKGPEDAERGSASGTLPSAQVDLR